MSEVLINTEQVALPADNSASLLYFLRENKGLTAAKPVCTNGDCSACLVLLAEPAEDPGPIRFRAVNSCLLLPEQVASCVLITPEGLAGAESGLTPVQQALVDEGAIQCGYCTPGLSVALTAALLNGDCLLDAVAGNLCRCTGYAGIRRACAALEARFPCRPRSLDEAVAEGLLPEEVVHRLRQWEPMSAVQADSRQPNLSEYTAFVAGATDWSVQHAHSDASAKLPLLLRRVPALRGVRVADEGFDIGAAVTLSELQQCVELSRQWPELLHTLQQFASPGIRNSATLGGNLANASPIADMAVVLLALDAQLELQGPQGTRNLPLSAFYTGYKRTALAEGEIIARIRIARAPERRLCREKVCRRPDDDIASINSALTLSAESHPGCFGQVRISAGGVGPVPLSLERTAAALSGQPINESSVRRALVLLTHEISPIDDLRGSAAYKTGLLRHQLIAHLLQLYPSLSLPDLIGTGRVRHEA